MTFKTKSVLSVLNLQLFADGSTSAGTAPATTAAVVTGGDNSITASNPIEDNATAEPKVIYGKQESSTSVSDTQENTRQSFEELVKSDDYKDEAQAYMDKAFKRRMKVSKDTINGLEIQVSKMRSILDMNNLRYGLDPNSESYLDDYAQAVQNDKKLYEDEALAAGMDVDNFMKIKNAERILAQNKRDMQSREAEELIQGHVERVAKEAKELLNDFPNFDIQVELQNPRFKGLVDPPELGGAGISVKDAFFAVHHNEIMKSYAQNAVSQATTQVANAVSTNKARPSENGVSGSTPVIIKDDPSKFELEDFQRIRSEYLRTGVRPKF